MYIHSAHEHPEPAEAIALSISCCDAAKTADTIR